jgi:hypothetical protein
MSLHFTDIKGNVIFTFLQHEYPETLPLGKETKLNKIDFPDGNYTNQILGTKPKNIEFSGKFYGSTLINGQLQTAYERSNGMADMMGKPIVIVYDVGKGAIKAYKQTVVIEDYEPEYLNDYEVNYKVTLIPHKEFKQVEPKGTTKLGVLGSLDAGLSKVQDATKGIIKGSGKPLTPQAKVTNPAATTQEEPKNVYTTARRGMRESSKNYKKVKADRAATEAKAAAETKKLQPRSR